MSKVKPIRPLRLPIHRRSTSSGSFPITALHRVCLPMCRLVQGKNSRSRARTHWTLVELWLPRRLGGVAQLVNSNRVFGQEVSGYGRYFAAAYGNHVLGDFMTEGVYPSLLHQDPRYFRKSNGSASSRLGYAISRVFWTQTDAGGTAFNYSRVLGTTSTVAMSSLYYAHHRDASISADALGSQLGAAMAANILKEFWPDLLRKISRKH